MAKIRQILVEEDENFDIKDTEIIVSCEFEPHIQKYRLAIVSNG